VAVAASDLLPNPMIALPLPSVSEKVTFGALAMVTATAGRPV